MRWLKLFQPRDQSESLAVADTALDASSGAFGIASGPGRRRGFRETVEALASHPKLAKNRTSRSRDSTFLPASRAVPFASTGPHGHRQRMREKLITRGADALADYELLEMLLFFAQPKGDTKPLAKDLINRFGSFARLLCASERKLLSTRGLGEHSVAAIKLVHASAIRLAKAEVIDKPVLNNWDRLMDYLSTVMSRERTEQFRVLFLDNRNRLLADEAQARGTVNHTPVYPREVAKRALEVGATAIILVHNHPSGDPTPSREDIEITRDIKQALVTLEIVLHDHVVVGNGRWVSFRHDGLL